jgi:hypothetical protein
VRIAVVVQRLVDGGTADGEERGNEGNTRGAACAYASRQQARSCRSALHQQANGEKPWIASSVLPLIKGDICENGAFFLT